MNRRYWRVSAAVVAIGVCLIPDLATGQDVSVTDSLARELVQIMVPPAQMRRMLDEMVTMTQQMASAQMSSFLEQEEFETEEHRTEAAEFMQDIQQQLLEDTRRFYFEEADLVSRSQSIYERLYAKYFSEQELRDILSFYRSSTGQRLVQTQADLAMEAMQALMTELAPLIQDFMARTLQRMTEAAKERIKEPQK
jgi:hypothetical protein